MLKKWEDLPDFIRIPEVRPYWEVLDRRRVELILKRIFDILASLVLLLILALPMIIIAIWIKLDSEGPVFFRQERVTTYGKRFRIHKFRTMVNNAERIGASLTIGNDSRITAVGKKLRNMRLDELPQLLDVFTGNMSFVGTRPEVVKYVEQYQPEFNATLLMSAGITSEASIRYKDEEKLLNSADDVNRVYIEEVLPAKMVWNLKSIREFHFFGEIATMIRTVFAVLGKEK